MRRREDGALPGELGRQMLAAAGSADLAGLQRSYYSQPHVPRDWARFARLVLESADPAAADIAGRAADAAAALSARAARLLDPPGRFPVVLAGGLMGNAPFRHAVEDRVATMSSRADVRVLEDAPVAGAVRLAGKAAGQTSGLS
jgi:N-acetylglucosamine kinase-like BadF-type ATPase